MDGKAVIEPKTTGAKIQQKLLVRVLAITLVHVLMEPISVTRVRRLTKKKNKLRLFILLVKIPDFLTFIFFLDFQFMRDCR